MAAPIYTDLNLTWEKAIDLKELISLALKLGYERVAVNNIVKDLKTGKKKKDEVAIPTPTELTLKEEELKSLQVKGRKLEQLSRITAVLEDASNTHRLTSAEFQAFDILAVQPTDEKTFQLACSTLEVDIICLDFSEPLGFLIKRPLLKHAAERGIHFEINYSPALKDSHARRRTISNALNLVELLKGKNIVLSSAASEPLCLRGPYDVINLSQIFGLNNVQAKNSISRNSRAVVMHAASRKICKSVISASLMSTLSTSDKWVLDAHKKLKERADQMKEDLNSDETSKSEGKEEGLNEPQRKKLKVQHKL